ncbi:hypothetical protein [Hymenobacter sp. HDW8]|uniref:hypothetical protein n=1 Tax=Hymenobacter sp. HDW8 TaxID=2714932 RepID=UPI00140D9C7D|nr:hypothetical protein [Hymenobacter sp. HDW8]QIL78415.1 hypothetical protein G7064_21580 [Hymenobacter sp. HDW8]
MLSQYSWSQFFVFVLVLLVLYYVVVGFLYYRDDISNILKGRKPSGGSQLAGAGTTATAPPPLVRSKSAFVATPAATESATTAKTQAEADTEAPEAGAVENLPDAAAIVVGGELPDSSATATGQYDGENNGPMDAAASVIGATAEAIAADESRQEQEDRPNPQLEALIRQKARQMPTENGEEPSNDVHTHNTSTEKNSKNLIAETNTEGVHIETMCTLVDVAAAEAEIVYQPAVAGLYEPLADFEELVASTADITPLETEELFEVNTVAAFISQLHAGSNPRYRLNWWTQL